MSNLRFPEPAPNPDVAAVRRLQREFQMLINDPLPGIVAMPSEKNILEWHYVIEGSPETDYEGGIYHGKVVFKPEFPWKAPAICMVTPNGRFSPNIRLCLSISDYHPETWCPGWTVSSILVGLHSFMNEDTISTGCVFTSPRARRQFARESINFNLNNEEFLVNFPEMAERLKISSSPISFDELEVCGEQDEAIVKEMEEKALVEALKAADQLNGGKLRSEKEFTAEEYDQYIATLKLEQFQRKENMHNFRDRPADTVNVPSKKVSEALASTLLQPQEDSAQVAHEYSNASNR